MRWCMSLAIVAVSCMCTVGQAGSHAELAVDQLKSDFPGVGLHVEGDQLARVYGPAFSFGASPEDSAAAFVETRSGVFGVAADELVPGSVLTGQQTQQMMYDRHADAYKFTLVYYSQQKNGLPVYGADLRLLVRNDAAAGYPLVLAASSLKNLDGVTLPAVPRVIDEQQAFAAAAAARPDALSFSSTRTVVWAGPVGEIAKPVVALSFVGDNTLVGSSEYAKWEFVADAATGEILHIENQIIFEDVLGNVSGKATIGFGADSCDSEVITPMPYAEVRIIGGNAAFADVNGDFVIPNDGTSDVTLQSPVAGEFFYVAGGVQVTEFTTPPGPVNIVHNESNGAARVRDGVNAYVQANLIRDFVLAQNPAYPTIAGQTDFEINVDLTSGYCPCNAWYDGSSLNFCRAGSGCPSTAFSSVVHHEFGHHVVATAGSGQGQYGEGMGDCMSMLMADNPILGLGFQGNCLSGLRNADNNYQYPCSGEIHDCGQLLSGAIWSTRTELAATNPFTYLEVISNLTVNSVLLHSGDTITPQITIDFLTLDDDDDDISNGTPHYAEIAAGFGAHNMDAPPLAALAFSYPDGRPEMVDPAGGDTIRVDVVALSSTPQPGTGVLHYNLGGGWNTQDMVELSPNSYEAVLPFAECGTNIHYYFSAETTASQVVTHPPAAPGVTFDTLAAYGLTGVFEDDFNTNQGWTVQNAGGLTDGAWQRGIPAGGGDRGDPPSDYDGSGYCYVTDNADDNSDVDDGMTYLISPVIDLSAGDARVSYAIWYTNYFGADPENDLFKVYVSNNAGGSWTLAQTLGPDSHSGWEVYSLTVGDFVSPSADVKLRFEASDLNAGSVVEAGVDAFSVERIECDSPVIPGDMNCDGAVDFDDIDGFVLALAGEDGYLAVYPDCLWMNADCDESGTIDFDDIDSFVALLGG